MKMRETHYLFSLIFILIHAIFVLVDRDGGATFLAHAKPFHSHHQDVAMNSGLHPRKIGISSNLKRVLGLAPLVSPDIIKNLYRVEDSVSDESNNIYRDVSVGSKERTRGWLPPVILFLFSGSSVLPAGASPLNPQTISLSGPFFQGWLLRTVDHRVNASFILIVGSFARSSSRAPQRTDERVDTKWHTYDEHYIFCGLCTADGTSRHFHSLPRSEDVVITGGRPSSLSLAFSHEKELNITWSAKGYGKFEFNSVECKAEFHFKDQEDGTLDIAMKATDRKPWSEKNSLAGPEGWLGYTSLLPCHYFVHTTSSICEYKIITKNRNNCEKKLKSSTGLTHVEGNYGTFFPQGWTWAQGISASSSSTFSESFSLVGGLFVIGGIQPINWVIYVRSGSERWEFRTTGGSQIKYRVSSSTGTVEVNATTPFRNQRLHMKIYSKHSSPADFSPAIYIPTANGFSNQPGCRETYTATAEATLYDSQDKIVKKIRFDLSALEFGGSFQGVDLEATRALID